MLKLSKCCIFCTSQDTVVYTFSSWAQFRFSKFGACSYIYTINIVHLLLWDIEQFISKLKEKSSTSFFLTFKKIDCTFLPVSFHPSLYLQSLVQRKTCYWAHPILFPNLLVCLIVCRYTRHISNGVALEYIG